MRLLAVRSNAWSSVRSSPLRMEENYNLNIRAYGAYALPSPRPPVAPIASAPKAQPAHPQGKVHRISPPLWMQELCASNSHVASLPISASCSWKVCALNSTTGSLLTADGESGPVLFVGGVTHAQSMVSDRLAARSIEWKA